MNISLIRSDEEHAVALAEIERLWNASEGSPEGDRLDMLTALVEAYEERHWPIEVPDSIDAPRHAIERPSRS